MWESEIHPGGGLDFPGITSARAEKISALSLLELRPKDHPCVCREKPEGTGYRARTRGAPPPRRGKADGDLALVPCVRITPANARKFFHQLRLASRSMEYPCKCRKIFSRLDFALADNLCSFLGSLCSSFNKLCNGLQILIQFRGCHFVHILTSFYTCVHFFIDKYQGLPLLGREKSPNPSFP